MGQHQSVVQMSSLVLLVCRTHTAQSCDRRSFVARPHASYSLLIGQMIGSALLCARGPSDSVQTSTELWSGIVPILAATCTSGLAGALSQMVAPAPPRPPRPAPPQAAASRARDGRARGAAGATGEGAAQLVPLLRGARSVLARGAHPRPPAPPRTALCNPGLAKAPHDEVCGGSGTRTAIVFMK